MGMFTHWDTVHEYNNNNETDRNFNLLIVCTTCMLKYIQTTSYYIATISIPWACLPIFVAIVVLQALTYTYQLLRECLWVYVRNVTLSVSLRNARICCGGIVFVARKTWIVINFFLYFFLIDLYLIGSIVL